MKVAAIQHDIAWEQPERTRENVRPLIAKAAADGARLIVLAEMFATGFSMEPDNPLLDDFLLSLAFCTMARFCRYSITRKKSA